MCNKKLIYSVFGCYKMIKTGYLNIYKPQYLYMLTMVYKSLCNDALGIKCIDQ